MWIARQTLLAAALAALGGGAWWLLQKPSGGEAPLTPRGRLPDYIVLRFNAIETDATGRPTRRLVAGELRQYMAENLAELDAPRLTLFQTDGPPWEAQSRAGLVLGGGDDVLMIDQVRVQRAGFGETRPVELTTSELEIWPKRQYAQGNRPVRIDSAGDWLTASGIRLWYQEPARAAFPGRTHIYLSPATAGGHPQESAP